MITPLRSVVLLLLVATAIPWVQQRIDARLGASRSQEQVLYLWSGEHVRKLAPGFANLLGDIYWLRTVQYFGGQRAFSKEKRFELLEPLIEITTELDPRLEIAYRYGAIFLCEPWPVGKGDAAAGVRVLEKGVRNIPGSWRIRQDLGYFRYIFLQDAPGGARVLLEASRLPGAPHWLEALAGTILARSGDRQTSRAVWTRMFEQAEPGVIRDNARYNLQRLDALDALEALNGAVARFREAHGRVPRSVGELRSALPGLDPRLLNDPTGAPFQYDAQKGRFWFSASSNLWRGPE